jgi:hypothetical protein
VGLALQAKLEEAELALALTLKEKAPHYEQFYNLNCLCR